MYSCLRRYFAATRSFCSVTEGFNTKSEFREAVREFTIQEGRRIQFIKNDAVRCKAVCKAEEYKWVVYASRDHEETCWQIKTFNDDHTCAREATNRATNRNWLTSKALADARAVVYGDEKAQYAMKFEVHGHPTNMVVDLGKRLCTCQFWMLTGMPCVHACAALARVNKRPEDFFHKWLTMDAYRDTYAHYINPLPEQSLWKKSDQNRPQAPKKKKKPGPLTKKRRKDADEGNEGSKKSKVTGTLKRQLKSFTCKYCLQKRHTKRGCPKKRAADVAQALADAATAAAKTKPTEQAPT
ncbi:hypothetical protein Ahy_B08g089797 [Arachis hypogaea]|uniref:SWIM-type domain-containing protein n=1 Tax=Arachis hypogaea TaxID=3818 RepID=A0A444XYV0_ARAHY|nr:hypothetical protein Ahy_B08g089797 [Arachis hypogaea]